MHIEPATGNAATIAQQLKQTLINAAQSGRHPVKMYLSMTMVRDLHSCYPDDWQGGGISEGGIFGIPWQQDGHRIAGYRVIYSDGTELNVENHNSIVVQEDKTNATSDKTGMGCLALHH